MAQNRYRILKDPTPNRYNCVDLFAGAGGTALGLENAGFRHVLLAEIDKNPVNTLRKNRPDWNIAHKDIASLDFTPYRGKIDLVEGGFPCQAFSRAGKKKGSTTLGVPCFSSSPVQLTKSCRKCLLAKT